MARRLNLRARRGAPVDAPVADINTTPLIDVMLVLLVMLIITIPVQLHAVNLRLPQASPPRAEPPPEVLRIDIEAAGGLRWNGTLLADGELPQRLAALAAQPEPPEVHVRPDAAASYDAFAAVMAAVSRAGLRRVGVVGSEQFIEP